MNTTAISLQDARDMLVLAQNKRDRYQPHILKMMSLSQLQSLAIDVLGLREAQDCISQYAVLKLINTHLDRQVGIAKYHIQESKKVSYQTQPIETHTPATQTTQLPEDNLDSLINKLRHVSGKHAGIYVYIADTLESDVARARQAHVDVLTHAITSLKLRACAAYSQELRLCIRRVLSIIEGN